MDALAAARERWGGGVRGGWWAGGVERRDGGKRVGRVIDKREGCAF